MSGHQERLLIAAQRLVNRLKISTIVLGSLLIYILLRRRTWIMRFLQRGFRDWQSASGTNGRPRRMTRHYVRSLTMFASNQRLRLRSKVSFAGIESAAFRTLKAFRDFNNFDCCLLVCCWGRVKDVFRVQIFTQLVSFTYRPNHGIAPFLTSSLTCLYGCSRV